MVPYVKASSVKWGTANSYNEFVSDRRLLVLSAHTHTPSTQWPTMVHWLSYQRNVKRETLAHFYFCEEREKRAVWQCISAWKDIQMTPAISLNNINQQNKCKKPHKCWWTLPWLTNASFMLEPLRMSSIRRQTWRLWWEMFFSFNPALLPDFTVKRLLDPAHVLVLFPVQKLFAVFERKHLWIVLVNVK